MIIGITGPSGSGKSTIAEYIKSKGYEVLDADKVAKELRPQYLPKIIATFGDEILTDGVFDNKKLAILVFNSYQAKEGLNYIMFPPVIAKLKESVKGKAGMIFIDIPVLFGSGAEPMFDAVILVNADRDTRIKRLVEGRGIDPEIAQHQVDSTTITYRNAAMCDLILWNNARGMEEMYVKVDEWLAAKKSGELHV